MVHIHLDDSELANLERDISGAPWRVQGNAGRALKRSAALVDKGMKQDARGHRYLPKLHRAVSHELLDPWTAEIGLSPVPGTQGRLAHIIVYGSVNNAPVYDKNAALHRSTPAIEKIFADAAEESVLGGER